MPPLLTVQTVLVCLVLAGVAAFVVGVVIALLASRKAPDGYEDQGGFHVGRRKETFVDGLKSYGWLQEEPPAGQKARPPRSK
jgi:hypothetical protein